MPTRFAPLAGPTLADGSIASAPGALHFFGGVAHDFATSGSVDTVQRLTRRVSIAAPS